MIIFVLSVEKLHRDAQCEEPDLMETVLKRAWCHKDKKKNKQPTNKKTQIPNWPSLSALGMAGAERAPCDSGCFFSLLSVVVTSP